MQPDTLLPPDSPPVGYNTPLRAYGRSGGPPYRPFIDPVHSIFSQGGYRPPLEPSGSVLLRGTIVRNAINQRAGTAFTTLDDQALRPKNFL